MTSSIQLTGTEKQIAYAGDIKLRLQEKLQKIITEAQEYIQLEKGLDGSDKEILASIFKKNNWRSASQDSLCAC